MEDKQMYGQPGITGYPLYFVIERRIVFYRSFRRCHFDED